ncbi:MAG TPA: hypothetical protein VGD40_01850 [Chryseosolibacter sp.]
MPSKKAYENLKKSGVPVDQNHYDYYDALESGDDISALMEVLHSFKGLTSSPVLTCNFVMGNPDFDKIRGDNYSHYHFEDFQTSYGRYYGNNFFSHWQQGIKEGLLVPQFHAREHVNVELWIKGLQAGDHQTLQAFDLGYCGVVAATPSPYQRHYLAAFHSTNPKDGSNKSQILEDGLSKFEAVFGYRSKSFIACNYTWPTSLEEAAHRAGVRLLQGQRVQLVPDEKTGGKIFFISHKTGDANPLGQFYSVRNAYLEPSSDQGKDWVAACINDISRAFFWKTPAIISTHRVNYIGTHYPKNRVEGLRSLKCLIQQIIDRWPDVQFMSTPQLLALMENK